MTQQAQKSKRYLTVEILKSKYSSSVNACNLASEAHLELESGPWSQDDIRMSKLPVLKLVTRQIGGREYKHVEPVGIVPAGMIGWMAGGTFVYSSDSRFPNQYPLSLHDRTETAKQYERLSQ